MLKILWQQEKTTVRDVWNHLRKNDPQLAYTSVLSIFQVMEKKGLVSHESRGKTYYYYPLQPRNKTIRSLLTDFVARVFDGASGEFLLHGIETGDLTKDEIDELETVLQKLKKERSTKKRGEK